MAPVLCVFNILRTNRSAMCKLTPRCSPKETKCMHRFGAISRYGVRHQSTETYKKLPRPKSKNSSTCVIRETNSTVTESCDRVKHVNLKSFEDTLDAMSVVTAVSASTKSTCGSVTNENLSSESLVPVTDEVLEKFYNLMNSHVPLRSSVPPLDSEVVRWDRSCTHTYDESFIVSDAWMHVGKSVSDVSILDSSTDVPEFRTQSEESSDLVRETEVLTDFNPLQITNIGEYKENIYHAGKANEKVKSKTKEKKVKRPKKTATIVKSKESTRKKDKKDLTMKSNLKISQGKLGMGVPLTKETADFLDVREEESVLQERFKFLEEEAEEEEEEMLVSPLENVKTLPKQQQKTTTKGSKKKKKSKKDEEKLKKLWEIKKQGEEASFNQSLEAYLNVCVNVGMPNRALHTLLYYRQCNKSSPSNHPKINSITPYNILLQELAVKGDYKKMEELLNGARKDQLKPNETTYGAMLSCLGRQTNSPTNTENIHCVLDNMKNEGIVVQNLLKCVDFGKLGSEYALQAISRYDPTLDLLQEGPVINYECNLVNTLNDSIHSTKVTSPVAGLVKDEDLEKWTKEQYQVEMKGEITIDSIQKSTNKNVEYFREKLKVWEGRWKETLLSAFIDQVECMKLSAVKNKRCKKMSLYPYLVTLPPEEFVQIMLHEVNHLAQGSKTYSPSRHTLYRSLGQQVFDRYSVQYKQEIGLLKKLEKVYTDYSKWYLVPKDEGATYIPRVSWQELESAHSEGPSLQHRLVEWPNPVLLALGQFLYNIIITNVMIWKPLHSEKYTYPALYKIERSYGYRLAEEIKIAPALLDLYQKSASPTISMDSTLSPMVIPPIPWVSTKLGGYLIRDAKIMRWLHNAYQQKIRMDEYGSQKLYPVMDSLNQLSTVPWTVNKPMLDVIVEVFNDKGSEELDIPPHPSECPHPQKISPGMSKEEIKKIRVQRQEYQKKKSEMHSLWCDALYKLSLAHHFRDRVFWFPHNMDFRGRVYPIPPHLNHLSSDVFRSILKFARGEKLGPKGLRWLKLHLINLTGHVKQERVEDRLKYCNDIMEDILDSADNPLTGRRWWTTSDEPWQTLAACKELAAALRSDDPEEYVSHLPIHQDGSCNGLQHYAALGRDEAGAVSVNLAPSERPQDVYSEVAKLVEAARKEDAAEGLEVAGVLDGYIKRKVIKQTVMTTVYGVTRYGARLQIEKQLKALDDFPPEHYLAASHYLVKKTFQSLEQMFTATKEIQDWFTDCARMVAVVCGENIEWVTPMGLPVVQPYCKSVVDKISASKLPVSFSMDCFQKPNVMKQKNAFPPNFIHSLDSTHMMLTSLYCHQAGITFVSVHDCFWTHASSVDTMNKICREQFVSLHSEPILEDLSSFLENRFAWPFDTFAHDGSALDAAKQKLNTLLATIPSKGEFDIDKVLKSVYFFS